MARVYALTGLGYGVLGMLLGIVMAATHNHGQYVTHAHIMLVGMVVSFIYAVCYQLWQLDTGTRLAKIQLWLHQLGALAMFVGLFLMYGNFAAPETMEPLLSLGSLALLAGLVLMKIGFLKGTR